jgi:hypothetical protein
MPLGRVKRIRSPCVAGGPVGEHGIIRQAAFCRRTDATRACRRSKESLWLALVARDTGRRAVLHALRDRQSGRRRPPRVSAPHAPLGDRPARRCVLQTIRVLRRGQFLSFNDRGIRAVRPLWPVQFGEDIAAVLSLQTFCQAHLFAHAITIAARRGEIHR